MNAKWSRNLGWGITILCALPLLMSGIMKLMAPPQVREGFAHLGLPESMILTLGILELACLVIYLIPPLAVMGAILLTGYMGGAIVTHLRLGEPIFTQVILGVVIWLGVFLREKRLHELLPLRTKDFLYEREIIIDLPLEKVFRHLKELKNFRAWNPFLRKDPNTLIEYRGHDGEPGFIVSWSGNRDVGSGEQEITKVVNNQFIAFELRFIVPFTATNQGYFQTEAIDAQHTRVKWGMRGRSAFPMNILSLVFSMEKMIGNEFEHGLKQLKQILEK